MQNAMTIDVEDYFHVSAFENVVNMATWETYPTRVDTNTRRILDLLDGNGISATFFVLGWVADRDPLLVREIHERGHEVACHGYWHRRVGTQTRLEFREDIRKSKDLLENLIGKPVIGYRAPSYSISLKTLWAFDELVDAGFLYDSSVFPVRHDLYGIANWPRFPFFATRCNDGKWHPETSVCKEEPKGSDDQSKILEIPITTLRIAGKNFPIAGGGYFRFFPYRVSHWGLERVNAVEKKPFVFYFHPWELDPDQPKFRGAGWKSNFRHYLNLDKTEGRLRSLISDFRFTTLENLHLMAPQKVTLLLPPKIGREPGTKPVG